MKTTCLEFVTPTSRPVSSSEPLAVLAAHAACALEHSIQRFTLASGQNLGHLEGQAAQDVHNLLREATQRGAQAKADATPPLCPVCQQKLTRLSADHPRTFETRFGAITVKRTRGYCKRCRKWRVPADDALGLEETAGYSPAVQEMAALLASKMPVEEASVVLERLTGVKLPRATLDREARRQGQRAQRLRSQLDRQAATDKKQLELTLEPYQMIIQMDAGTSANAIIGEKAPPGAARARNSNAGTGCTPAPAFAWIIAARRRADDPSSWNAASWPRVRALTDCASNSTPKPCGAAWARPPARWSSGMALCGSGVWPTTAFLKRGSDWTFTMPCNT
jgi:hypothetical protein